MSHTAISVTKTVVTNFPKANTQPQLAPLCTFLLRIRVEGLVNYVTTGPGKIINELTGKTFADPAHTVESFPKKLFEVRSEIDQTMP